MEARTEPWRPTAIVTGANRGLGLALSATLSTKGYRVIVSSRSLVAAQEACRTLSMDLSSDTVPDLVPAQLDISCLESCANFATCSGNTSVTFYPTHSVECVAQLACLSLENEFCTRRRDCKGVSGRELFTLFL